MLFRVSSSQRLTFAALSLLSLVPQKGLSAVFQFNMTGHTGLKKHVLESMH